MTSRFQSFIGSFIGSNRNADDSYLSGMDDGAKRDTVRVCRQRVHEVGKGRSRSLRLQREDGRRRALLFFMLLGGDL